MKIGIVGAGKWGAKVAQAFESEGCEIAAYDRKSSVPAVGFGERIPWRNMIAEGKVNAVALCGPPSMVYEAAMFAQNARMPALATKPFLVKQLFELRAPLMIDYWRLWDPHHLLLKERASTDGVREISVSLCGAGPIRATFPGIYDYGPHVIAFLHDVLGPHSLEQLSVTTTTGENTMPLYHVEAKANDVEVHLVMGNGADQGVRDFEVITKTGEGIAYVEGPTTIWGEVRSSKGARSSAHVINAAEKKDHLRPMIREFITECVTGRYSNRTLAMSLAACQEIDKILRCEKS